jgi:cytochrome c556
MKKLVALSAITALTAFSVFAQEAEDPFADVVETRHGLMLQMGVDAAKLGAIVKGEAPFDAAIAGKAAANIAAIASVLSLDQFPAGSETGKSADSFAKAEIWTAQDDFLAKITDLNTAAAALVTASATDAAGLKAGLGGLGAACSACHKAYRAPES